MIPNKTLASQKLPAPFLHERRDGPLDDYEQGGVALQDPSQGLQVQTWHCFVVGDDIRVEAPNTPATTLLAVPGLEQVSLAFDQNMQPNVAYVSAGQAYWWWYDTTTQSHQTLTMASDVITPRATLDDKRTINLGNSDIILAYIRGSGLYYRQQRDRYDTEYLLDADAGPALHDVGMAANNRLQFVVSRGYGYEPPNPPDPPSFSMYVTTEGSSSVIEVDPDSNSAGAPVALPAAPNGVASDGQGRIYIPTPSDGTVQVLAEGALGTPVAVSGYPRAISTGGVGRVYLCAYLGNNVVALDTSTDTIIATIPVCEGPWAATYDCNTTLLCVGNSSDHTASIIDTETNTVVGAPLPVGTTPLSMAFDDVGKVFVGNSTSQDVTVLDTASHSVATTIPLGSGPTGVAFDGEDLIYVCCYGSGFVYTIHKDTFAVSTDFLIGAGLSDIQFDGDHHMYMTDSTQDSILVMDITSNTLSDTISLAPNSSPVSITKG